MSEELFRVSMAFLMQLFGYTLSDDVYKTYWNLLKSFTDEEFKKVQKNIVSTFVPTKQVPFPLPAHFLSASGKNGESRSRLAVSAVIKASSACSIYNSISFGDRALHETIERFGGWPTVASWTQEDWRFQEKTFIACYESALIAGTGPEKCMGIAEFQNRDRFCVNEFQRKMVENQKTPVLFDWTCFDNNMAIDDKSNKTEKIVDLSELTKKIGKSIEAVA